MRPGHQASTSLPPRKASTSHCPVRDRCSLTHQGTGTFPSPRGPNPISDQGEIQVWPFYIRNGSYEKVESKKKKQNITAVYAGSETNKDKDVGSVGISLE